MKTMIAVLSLFVVNAHASMYCAYSESNVAPSQLQGSGTRPYELIHLDTVSNDDLQLQVQDIYNAKDYSVVLKKVKNLSGYKKGVAVYEDTEKGTKAIVDESANSLILSKVVEYESNGKKVSFANETKFVCEKI